MGDKRGAYRALVVRPEDIRQLGRPRSRWEDNFKIDLQKVISGGMGWNYLVQDKYGSTDTTVNYVHSNC
jgi:hypothetical protein